MQSIINNTFISCYVQYLQHINLHCTHTGVREVVRAMGWSSELAIAPRRTGVVTKQAPRLLRIRKKKMK